MALKWKKRRLMDVEEDDAADTDAEESSTNPHTLYVYTLNNHIYFNADVTERSMFRLCKELRVVAQKVRLRAVGLGVPVQPIYLHVSTNGGEVGAAFSAVDCIQSLGVPVYSVVDGFVASAGTLITLAAAKRYIQPNAYMLIHQLSSGVWGKMNDIREQVENLKKLMSHITTFYLKHTKLKSKELQNLLLTDVTWNARECIDKSIADDIYVSQNAQ